MDKAHRFISEQEWDKFDLLLGRKAPFKLECMENQGEYLRRVAKTNKTVEFFPMIDQVTGFATRGGPGCRKDPEGSEENPLFRGMGYGRRSLLGRYWSRSVRWKLKDRGLVKVFSR